MGAKPTKNRAIGLAVYRRRARLGLSRDRLAEVTGLSRWCIRSIELGTRQPGLSTLDAIARALGVTSAGLLRATRE